MPGPGGGVMVRRRGWIRVIHGDRQGEEAMTEHPNVELARRDMEVIAEGDLAANA